MVIHANWFEFHHQMLQVDLDLKIQLTIIIDESSTRFEAVLWWFFWSDY